MPREFPRSRRIEEAVQRILSEAMSGKIRDPRLAGVNITDVSISRDLSMARVYYTVLQGSGDNAQDVEGALQTAAGFFRALVAKELRVRRVPELRFFRDQTFDRARALERIISSVMETQEVKNEGSDENDSAAGTSDGASV